MERNSRQYENLRRDISSHLKEFERNREWADFSNWLHRLLETLGNKKFPTLPQQINLCKRLAQCLNPSLPSGVHSTALKVYQKIFQNFSEKSELVALAAVGLLPFFQHGNIQNKHTALKIFETYFVRETDVEGVQMIVALVNTLLTVLNENSEQLAKKVYSLCDKINNNFGKIWVDGAVWINILKSPKVRLAGFKYFTKVFRDRDRAIQSQEQKLGEQAEKEKQTQQIQRYIQSSQLPEEDRYLLTSIYGCKYRPDQPNLRFPNFSTLVLNALSVCLDSPDNMVKRAALDLLGTYLKLNSGVIPKMQGIILVQRMLLLLQNKEYSLTNRVYKYLFDQPNSEGVFHIDRHKKVYELEILRDALINLIQPKAEKLNENVFIIIELLIGDHVALTEFLLQSLAQQIVTFAQQLQQQKKESVVTKTVTDFYLKVIFPRRKLFVSALLANIPSSDKKQLNPFAPNFGITLDGLKFYFSRMEKIVVSNRKRSAGNSEEIEEKRIDQTKESVEYLSIRVQALQRLVEYLYKFRPYQENESLAILDLCNQLLAQIQIVCDSKQEGISGQQAERIMILLSQEAELKRKKIYAKLLTLLPKPKKELLLPYIQDNALSIVCINQILGGDRPTKEVSSRNRNGSALKAFKSFSSKSGSISFAMNQPIALEQQEQKKVFFAIFKLLNCHLFESRALEFIERFKNWWGDIFTQLVEKIQPSQWLIYWKRLNGEVAGGVVRMIQNLECLNSYHQHLSRKWIKESQNIIAKVLEPIYGLFQVKRRRKGSVEEEEAIVNFKQWNIAEYQKIYSLLKLVFKFTSSDFVKFFYLQHDKYLAPLVLFIFKCLQNNSFTIKSNSISMLTFVLNCALLPSQKIVYVGLTISNIVSILDATITKKKELGSKIDHYIAPQNEADRFSKQGLREELVLWDNLEIELLQYVSTCIKRLGGETAKSESKPQQQQATIACLKDSNMLGVVMKGIINTQTFYIKRFYIDISREMAQLLVKIDKSKKEVQSLIWHILEKLLILLHNSDLNKLEQMIKSRNDSGPKEYSTKRKQQEEPVMDVYSSFSKEVIAENQIKENLNLEEKYSEIIELWKTVKFYLSEAVKLQIKKLPTINLLSLVLKTFPLSYLKYAPVASFQHSNNMADLQEELGNVTGLKEQVFEIFAIIWNRQSKEILDFLIEKSDPRILIHSKLDPSKVLQTFLKVGKLREIAKYLRPERFNLPKNMLHYNLQNLLIQNQLMFFIYLYLLYCNLKELKPSRIRSFTESLIELTDTMKTSPHIQTKLWLLQLIDLVAHRMLNSKDFMIQGGNHLKQKLQSLTKDLFNELQSVISKSKTFTKRNQLKSGIFSLFTKQEKQTSHYDFVKVFPPTISYHFQKYQEASKKSQEMEAAKKIERQGFSQQPRERVSQFLMAEEKIFLQKQNKIEQFLFSKFMNRTQEEFAEYLSLCSLLTLIRIGNSVLLHLYDKESKVNLIVKEFLQNVLPISDNKQPSNLLTNQLIAQYLQTLLDHDYFRPETIKNCRKGIIQSYMKDDFFKCTQPTLGHWRKVIDYCTESYDLLGQLLSKEGLLQGIFTRKAEGIRLKIKSFQRVCFVIWAGKVDKYENKLRTVLESLNQVMKQEEAAPALLILILFCIRILLMRLSVITLNKIFRSVWPSLITLLIQIFKKDKAQKNPNLLLAALKVIDLVHALEIEDFMLHRWIFLFDYFGIKLDPIGQIEDNLTNCEIFSPFVFKPYVTNCLPNNRYRCKFLHERQESQLKTNKGIHKRRLIVKNSFVQSEEEVKQSGLLLMQYMMDLNEYRAEVQKADIDRVIQEDFITLDDYIFKIK